MPLFSLREECKGMAWSTCGEKWSHKAWKFTYNILRALSTDADFLYDTFDTYINYVRRANRNDLADRWDTIKMVEIFTDAKKSSREETKQKKLKG
jgi:hypothetical protein